MKNVEILPVSRDEFIRHITSDKADSFAKTFRAKCDMMRLWDKCFGLFEGDELCSAVIFTISKNNPAMMNLQLLHTFCKHRRKGYAKKLTLEILNSLIGDVDYIRVSAEKTAVPFYESIGFKFLGEQKSGTLLSVCKVTSESIDECSFDKNDAYINKCLNRNGKGGCVKIF